MNELLNELSEHTNIGFIGGGNMARSRIGGLIPETLTAKQVFVFEPNPSQAEQLQSDFSINLAQDNQQLIESCDVIVLAVKPQVLKQVLQPLAETLRQHKPLIVSIVAGIEAHSIENWLEDAFAIVRVMPNTPALVGAGASGLFANTQVTPTQRQIAQALLNAVGYSVWVNSEEDIDSVTALSGSGPAYFMLFMQSLINAAIDAGLDPESAKNLAIETAAGAAALVKASDQPLDTLIKNVTSPGGTTEQAMLSFKQSNLTGVVADAFTAAKERSEELAEELSK